MHSFGPNCRETAQKCYQENVLKALSSTDWGQYKETLLMTYKALVRSKIEYAAPVITPTLSDSNVEEKHQKVQNSALRTITGCHTMSHIYHLVVVVVSPRGSGRVGLFCLQVKELSNLYRSKPQVCWGKWGGVLGAVEKVTCCVGGKGTGWAKVGDGAVEAG